jgi:hypothetical protein
MKIETFQKFGKVDGMVTRNSYTGKPTNFHILTNAIQILEGASPEAGNQMDAIEEALSLLYEIELPHDNA